MDVLLTVERWRGESLRRWVWVRGRGLVGWHGCDNRRQVCNCCGQVCNRFFHAICCLEIFFMDAVQGVQGVDRSVCLVKSMVDGRFVVVSGMSGGGVVVAALSASEGIFVASSSSAVLAVGCGVVVVGKVVIVASSSSTRGVVVSVVNCFVASLLSLLLVFVVVVRGVGFASAVEELPPVVVAQRAGEVLRAVSLLQGGREGWEKTKLSHILRMSSVSCLRSCCCGGRPMGMYVACRTTAVGPVGSWSFWMRSSDFATAAPL